MAVEASSTLTVFTGCIIVTLYVINRVLRGKSDGRRLPPGPKGIPILGNIIDLPKPGELEWEHWLHHKDLYGKYSILCFVLFEVTKC